MKQLNSVVLIEDDAALREATAQTLSLSGFEVQVFDNASRAARYITPSFAGCVVTDIRMDGMDGLQLLARIMEIDREIPVIMITGHGDIKMAVRAMQDGAFDFLAKPFAAEHLSVVVRKALNSRQLVIDNRILRAELAKPDDDMIARSSVMAQLRNLTGQVAQTDLDIAIEGESGTGKEMLARRIHQQSKLFAQPFVVVSCAALSPEAGFEQLIQQAGKGTLFLDGSDTLSLSLQARLVAALDARVGTGADHDFRIIASTPIALADLLANGSLRSELFHRLGSITLRIPPLRERREDIPALFARFVRDALSQTGKKRFDMSAADRKRLLEHDWPGNARELRNYVFGAVLNLPRESLGTQSAAGLKSLSMRLSAFEKMVITETLEATAGNIVRACALLGTPRKTLYEKLAKHQIDAQKFRQTSKD